MKIILMQQKPGWRLWD